jgi:MEMO1 family protein
MFAMGYRTKTLLFIFLFVVQACMSQMKNNDTNRPDTTDRRPAVAGSFYPADPVALKDTLKEAFARAEPKKTAGTVLAIISPHAGYVYSAKVAASAFNQIDISKTYEHIFVIGSSHSVHFEGASIYTSGNYMTPLGRVKTDPLGKELVKNDGFTNNSSPHQNEHSLEVQLPFLQYILKDSFSIVPIILGTQSTEVCRKIATALKPYFNEKNLFVISTDFSHYPDYETAKSTDSLTAGAVVSNSPDKLIKAMQDIENSKNPGLLTGMCGWTSVLTLMDISRDVPGIHIRKVDYQNSGDTRPGDKLRVVGYMAMTFETSPSAASDTEFMLTGPEKQTLLTLARHSIDEFVRHKHIPPVNQDSLTPNLKKSCGVFVSLHIQNNLRGCIGTFRNDKPLYQNIQEMAIAAATKDYRFDPVTIGEVSSLTIEISVLTPMRKISSIDEIVLGKHGICIKKDGKTGTLLPQVAADRGWTREQFLGYCSRDKAGLGWDGWKNAGIFIYEALIFNEN